MRFPELALCLGIATVVAGCAVQPQSPQTFNYGCDDGREFALRISPSGETASIEIARMHFDLLADPASGSGESFSCSMLTLWRQGEEARVDMEGASHFRNCRVKR